MERSKAQGETGFYEGLKYDRRGSKIHGGMSIQ